MTMETKTSGRGNRKVRKGTVVSRSGDRSIVVQTERRKRHPLYGKVVRFFKRYHAHDAENAAKIGDKVSIEECRPISRTKHWRLKSVETDRTGTQMGEI